METNNIYNPPAFPCEQRESYEDSYKTKFKKTMLPGMSLRDYYAGKALQGICAHVDTWGLNDAQIAERCYGVADEMLKARQTTNKE